MREQPFLVELHFSYKYIACHVFEKGRKKIIRFVFFHVNLYRRTVDIFHLADNILTQ